MIAAIIDGRRTQTTAGSACTSDTASADGYFSDEYYIASSTSSSSLYADAIQLAIEPEKPPRVRREPRIAAPVGYRPGPIMNRRISPRSWTGKNFKKGAG
jgi:hypothetical protein